MRTFLFLAAIVALPAYATGERVVLDPAAAPLAQTICVSMNCVTKDGVYDVSIAAKEVKGALQFTVLSPSGQVKLVTQAALGESGQPSSTQLVRATSLIVRAIEGGGSQAQLENTKTSAKSSVKPAKKGKKSALKLMARR